MDVLVHQIQLKPQTLVVVYATLDIIQFKPLL